MTDKHNALLLVVGALHIDEIAYATAPIIVGESNPVNWSRLAGGVAANVARAAANLPTARAVLVANIGTGKSANELSTALQSANVKVLPMQNSSKNTGRYSAILQNTGELLVGLADVEQAKAITLEEVEKLVDLTSVKAMVLDTNLSSDSLLTLSRKTCTIQEPCLIAAVGVSPSKIKRLQTAMQYLDILFCNESEARSLGEDNHYESTDDLKNLLPLLCRSGCKHIVMTRGKDTVRVYSNDQHSVLDVPPVANPFSVNGPGDALAGATLAAVMHGPLTHSTLVDAVKYHGIPAATKVVTGEHKAPNLSNH